MNIRPAQLTDLPDLLRFEQGVIAAERPYNKDIREDARYYDLHLLINDELSLLLVAEQDGLRLGCGYAQIRESKAHLRHQRQSYLGFMYVEPVYRGKGINQQIIAALVQWSREQQAQHCYLDVYTENVAAIRAYEKVGFGRSLVEMKLQLT